MEPNLQFTYQILENNNEISFIVAQCHVISCRLLDKINQKSLKKDDISDVEFS